MHGWGFEGDWDGAQPLQSVTFPMEWPPKSGRMQWFPEVDRVEFFGVARAKRKIKEAQRPLIERLERHLSLRKGPEPG